MGHRSGCCKQRTGSADECLDVLKRLELNDAKLEGRRLGSFPKQGDPNIDPKILYWL